MGIWRGEVRSGSMLRSMLVSIEILLGLEDES